MVFLIRRSHLTALAQISYKSHPLFFTFDHTHPYSTHPSSLSPIIIKIGGPVLEIQPFLSLLTYLPFSGCVTVTVTLHRHPSLHFTFITLRQVTINPSLGLALISRVLMVNF